MSPFNFTLTDLLLSWVSIIPWFIIAKILAHNGQLRRKEIVYAALASLVYSVFLQITNTIHALAYISNFLVMLYFFLYFYTIAVKPAIVAFISSFFSFVVVVFTEPIVLYSVAHFFPAFPAVQAPLPRAIFILSIYVLSIAAALLLVNGLRKFFASIAQAGRLQSTLALISAFLFLSFQIIVMIQQYLGHSVTLFSWDAVFIIGYTIATFICFFFYTRTLKANLKVQEKEIEHNTLLYYMDECEHQQSAMRKFRHDQKNILSSLDFYIAEQDLAGLTEYYTSSIKPAFAIITQSEFALEGLAKIKVREIKSVLAAKLNMAQNLGLEVRFDAVNEINNIPVDSVSLVRMLGIVLDNAIEELQELGAGTLSVACFKDKNSISFVVQNTCRSDIPPLRLVKQPGWSSKGKGRGIGLDNLSELVNALPNVALQTGIENGQFIQTIIIGGRT